jgi:hypothetical protein
MDNKIKVVLIGCGQLMMDCYSNLTKNNIFFGKGQSKRKKVKG